MCRVDPLHAEATPPEQQKEHGLLKHRLRLASVAAGVAVLSAIGLTACTPNAKTLAVEGSDTTENVMAALSNAFNNSSSDDTAVNVPTVLSGSTTFSVPGDKQCGAQTVRNGASANGVDDGTWDPPNGSTAGKTALKGSGTDHRGANGCIDIARSSSNRGGSDPATFEYYAFAKDGLSWARFPNACPGGDASPAGCAPLTLTQTQLKQIYLCTNAGNPAITNWSQVGGDNEPIIRYLPQTGSGTLSFFQTTILQETSAQQNVLDDTACNVRPLRTEENTGNQVASGNRAAAITPYSFAQWTAQSTNTVPDVRAGSQLGRINNVAPNATTINNGTFLGWRYVFNVVRTDGPSYQDAVDFVGVDNGGNGWLCTNDSAKNNIITQYGFLLLPNAAAGGGVTTTSRCRKNP
jgi:phosphate transport system substrate-binding protein